MASLNDLFGTLGLNGQIANQRGLIAPTLSTSGLNLWDPNPNQAWYDKVGSGTTIGGNSFYVPTAQTRDYGNAQDSTLASMLSDQTYGRANAGIAAFLGDGYRLNNWDGQYGGDGQSTAPASGFNLDPILQLGQQVGFDTSPYNFDQNNQGNRSNGIEAYYADLNNALKDYTSVQGLSSWTGNSNPMAASRTMYQRQGDQLIPVTAPQEYIQQKGGAWNNMKDTGFISALSMLMPAFGGWGGIAGSGTAGTLTAGGGLGLTNGLAGTIGAGATNLAVNAGMNSLISGSGLKGFGANLAGGLANAGLSSATGGKGLSGLFDTSTAGQSLAQNPMGNFGSAINSSGLGQSVFGNAYQALGAGSKLGQLFSGGQYGV